MPPDFVGIGAQKAGTTWLARNLSLHPGIWMPPLKEIHYFGHPPDWRDPLRFPVHDLPMSAEDEKWMARYDRIPRNDDWYVSLFRDGDGRKTGEITPAYAILDRKEVSRVHRLMPGVKIVFMIRNPAERVWSQSVMYFERQGRDACRVPFEDLRDHARLERVRVRSNYLRTLNIWRSFFPKENFFVGFMEDIRFRPAEFLGALYGFLGVDPDFRPPDFEHKAHSRSAEIMPGRFASLLAAQNLGNIQRLCDRFGGYADFWLRIANELVQDTREDTIAYPFWDSDSWKTWISERGTPPRLQSGSLKQIIVR